MAMKLKEINGFKSIRDSFKTRQVKYGGYAALITLAVIVGLILLNLIVGQLSPQIDMTESGIFSLSEQTVQVLDQIKEPVKFIGLWQPGYENQTLIEVIDLYRAKNSNIHLEIVDPNKNPGLTARYDKTNQGIQQGSLVVEGAKGFKVIGPNDFYDYYSNQSGQSSVMGVSMERRITSALLFIGTGQTPVIYETQGHQEMTLAELGLYELLERENFTVKQIYLTYSDIPSDASALVISVPSIEFSKEEADKVLNYLEKGGRLLLMADYRVSELGPINDILASYGMRFDYGVLVENDLNHYYGNQYNCIPVLLDHDITKPLIEQRLPILLRFSMGISELSAKRRSVELKPFLSSSSNSFVRVDLASDSGSIINTDIPGPITVGMTAMDPSWIQGNEPQARIVAISSGPEPWTAGNFDLLMNSITWLEDRPETLTVRSKSMFLLPMRISAFQMILFGVIIVILIPLAFFVTGFVIWLKRRHL